MPQYNILENCASSLSLKDEKDAFSAKHLAGRDRKQLILSAGAVLSYSFISNVLKKMVDAGYSKRNKLKSDF